MGNPIPSSVVSPLTGNPLYDTLTVGYQWTLGTDRTIDWSISGGFLGETWTSTEQLRLGLQVAFETISTYVNVRFNFVGVFSDPTAAARAGSEINVALSTEARLVGDDNEYAAVGVFPNAAFDTDPDGYPGIAGDIILNANGDGRLITDFLPGSSGYLILQHELGHVLGLKHPHDDGGTGRPTFDDVGLEALNTDWGTVMAYEGDDDDPRYFPVTPMMLDVLALRSLYGPNFSTNAGDNAHLVRATGRYSTIWDAGGHDTIDISGSIRGWAIYLPDDTITDLDPVRVGEALPLDEAALDAPQSLTWLMGDIEDVRGSPQDDQIIGNVLNNVLSGAGGDDYVDGWSGDDSLDGGAGNDRIFGDLGADTITDASGSNYLRGEDGNDSIVGGSGFDDINGNVGADTASGGLGEDWVVGGKDNDSLSGGEAYDLVYGNLGNDTCDGGAGNDIVRGGQQDDVILGGTGDDYLSGDKGSDTMTGGAGADMFHSFGDAGLDRVTDFNLAEGDRVLLDAGTTYTLEQAGADVVINMTGGAQMILVGVSMSALTGSWIVVG